MSVNQDSIVPLKVPTAKLVIKDLISYDGLKLELIEKDRKIELKDQQISLYDNMAKDLQKELKVQKMKTKFYKAGSILGIGVAIITTSLYLAK